MIIPVKSTNIYPERIVFDPCLQFFICSSAATKHFTVLEETIFTAVSELNFTFGKYHDNNAWNFFTSVPHSNNKQDELVSSTFNFQHGFQHDHLHSKIFDLAGKSISLVMANLQSIKQALKPRQIVPGLKYTSLDLNNLLSEIDSFNDTLKNFIGRVYTESMIPRNPFMKNKSWDPDNQDDMDRVVDRIMSIPACTCKLEF